MLNYLKKLPVSIILLITLILASCSSEKQEIHEVLDARDIAFTAHDTAAYSALLHPNYNHLKQNSSDVIERVKQLFSQFDMMEMHSRDRTIYFVDDTHAQCEQSYRLRVKADNRWREINRRERIELTKSPDGWKISGGL
ncbi:hypothetical protein Ga0123461_1647 [Mariprofundus aestuarium]|uniref:DUF4440 domain-containing protein n=1 Tax=Mariprofundus aestuarium TaxID=1921086 RepID=A0A2K8KYH3_MARES|nr:nuclear transport factor 2 family protein [Mariprofundus aestuarium]ATX80060.1 hypothetical protein Ga0123461_1647 [Mariprofundus aestuarium]